jgi:hypothetical protein
MRRFGGRRWRWVGASSIRVVVSACCTPPPRVCLVQWCSGNCCTPLVLRIVGARLWFGFVQDRFYGSGYVFEFTWHVIMVRLGRGMHCHRRLGQSRVVAIATSCTPCHGTTIVTLRMCLPTLAVRVQGEPWIAPKHDPKKLCAKGTAAQLVRGAHMLGLGDVIQNLQAARFAPPQPLPPPWHTGSSLSQDPNTGICRYWSM